MSWIRANTSELFNERVFPFIQGIRKHRFLPLNLYSLHPVLTFFISLSLCSLLISHSNSVQKDCSCVDNCSEHCTNVGNTIANMEITEASTANENVNPSSTRDDEVVVNVDDNDNKCATLADQVDAMDTNNNERYGFIITLIRCLSPFVFILFKTKMYAGVVRCTNDVFLLSWFLFVENRRTQVPSNKCQCTRHQHHHNHRNDSPVQFEVLSDNGIVRMDMSKIIDRTGLPTYDAAIKLESFGYV